MINLPRAWETEKRLDSPKFTKRRNKEDNESSSVDSKHLTVN